MFHYKNGNLLESDCTVIMHQCNCFSTMGAGIAEQIAKMHPIAEKVDLEYLSSPGNRLGNFTCARSGGVVIANLYGQYLYGKGKQTDYKALESAIDKFFTHAKQSNINLSKVGVPYKIGCGLAGGDWNIVQEILERLSCKHMVDIYIYKL